MHGSILVVAQHTKGKVDVVTYEAVSCAMKLCKENSSHLKIVVLGDQTELIADEISKKTGINTIGVNNKYLNLYNSEVYIESLLKLFEQLTVEYVVIPHTSTGYDFAPLLAVKLGASCITEVEDINTDKDKPSFIRAMFNGKLYTEVVPNKDVTIITTQPGSWQPMKDKADKKGDVNIIRIDIAPKNIKSIALKEAEFKENELNSSEIIISAGRGIGKRENLSLIYELARLFPKSAVGCSRAVCDAGWLDYKHQIGITGNTVSPKLYMAVGISGAIQHTSGIKDAQMIVAINNDPSARIFSLADYGIVEDLTQFIPLLIQEYKKLFFPQKP